MNRYKTLIDIVNQLQPKHVVEIGTWNGERAAQFMGVSNCYYTGFDLFEDATPETDKAEYNVKKNFEIYEVGEMLETKGFNKFSLIRGNTNETLKANPILPFDFAFIDGGHSIDTIKNDFDWVWANIEGGGTIILDDYYTPKQEGLGCNFLIEDYELEILDPTDRTAICGVSLARINKPL